MISTFNLNWVFYYGVYIIVLGALSLLLINAKTYIFDLDFSFALKETFFMLAWNSGLCFDAMIAIKKHHSLQSRNYNK